MKKIHFILGIMFSSMAYADEIEVNGKFVIAPIASENCNATAITEPSSELSIESDLYNMLTYFWNNKHQDTNIDAISVPKGNIMTIYSPNGQKQNELKNGFNIVVDSQGNVRKIHVK